MPAYEYRLERKKVSDERTVIVTANNAVSYLKEHCYKKEEMWRESCFLIFLDKTCTVMGHMHLGTGTEDKVLISKKTALLCAVKADAKNVILSHNHSGACCRPSQADVRLTEEVKQALSLVDIGLVDHIIVTEEGYYSFADEKMFKN